MSGSPDRAIQRHHHVSLGVGRAQEDYDFHAKLLSLKRVKQTALYDGDDPVSHVYYGNDLGEASTLVTCFAMRPSGRRGSKGSGQVSVLSLAVPGSSLSYWAKRLTGHGLRVADGERFGERLLRFQHPCGIDYELVGIEDDDRKPFSNGEVPAELAIRGTHAVTVSARELEASEEFLSHAWSAVRVASDGVYTRYGFGKGGSGRLVDLAHEPQRAAGTHALAEGTIHHCAFSVADFEVQDRVRVGLQELGFRDVTERIDRGYFDSIYVRMPAGALFEAAVSKPEGFLIDESYADLGTRFQVPAVFASRGQEFIEHLEPVAL